jgi:hypothetical protein
VSDEKELLSILSEKEYKQVVTFLKKELGNPRLQKRLSLQSDDYSREDVDTRIRITNGRVELMQKTGDWKNITKGKSRRERSISLPAEPKLVFDLYKMLINITGGSSVENIIMQFESLIWETKAFEIKLTHQFGGGDGYNAEVEVHDKSLSPRNVAGDFKIPVHLPMKSIDFWREWNNKVNLSADSISDRDLLTIIRKYL